MEANNPNSKAMIKHSQIRALKNRIRRLNPGMFHFNKDSSFIYEPVFSDVYYNILSDKNHMKLTKKESHILNLIVENNKENNEHQIFVLPFFNDLMNCVVKVQPVLNKRDAIIKDIILSLPKNENISIKKVTEKFNNVADNYNLSKLQKSSIHKIMRNKLKMNFKKKSIKNRKLISQKYIRFSYFFMKIISRALSFGLNFIYIDESGFQTINNNYKTWVFKDEEIYLGNGENKKVNLILAVSKDKIFHSKINSDNTTSQNFLIFMKELVAKMDDEEKKNNVIIMDNCKCHLTLELFKFYKENKLKILFGVPYASQYNMAEIVFRYIKNYTYKKVYCSIKQLIEDINNILNGDSLGLSLQRFYTETIGEYVKFNAKNEYINLNN